MQVIKTASLVTPESIANLDPDTRENVYNGLDCCVTLEVAEEILPQLDPVAQRTYKFSKDLQAPIMEMSARGLLVDMAQRKKSIAQLEKDLLVLERNFKRIVAEVFEGWDINWRSPKQLMELFYDRMGLKPIKARRANNSYGPTINREALEKLQVNFYAQPLISHLFVMRDCGKKLSFLRTGLDSDNCIRSSFNIAGTVTGRLASSGSETGTGSNLQNIGRNLRINFIPRKGKKYGNLDLEQADARNLGAMAWNIFYHSHGPEYAGAFLDACESGDLHTTVARGAYPHLPWTGDIKLDRAIADDDTNYAYRNFTFRDQAKRLGHGTNFVGQPATMAMHTKVPKRDIETFQRNYFERFPCIPGYHDWVREQLRTESSLTTLLGRRRYFWGRWDDPKTLRDAVAYGPQSTTGDEINTGLLRMWLADRVDIVLQVHDSILFEYPEELEAEIIPWALEILRIKIPLIAGREFVVPTEAKVGWNFGDFDKNTNPAGLMKWRGAGEDTRKFEHAGRQIVLD